MRVERPAHDDPGHVRASAGWGDDRIEPGTRVEASDGPLGVVRERRVGEEPEHAYLGVEVEGGGPLLFVPDRLIREMRGNTVVLSLPRADVEANASRGELPVQPAPDVLPLPKSPTAGAG